MEQFCEPSERKARWQQFQLLGSYILPLYPRLTRSHLSTVQTTTKKKLQQGRMVPEHSGWSSQTLSVGSCSDGNSFQGRSWQRIVTTWKRSSDGSKRCFQINCTQQRTFQRLYHIKKQLRKAFMTSPCTWSQYEPAIMSVTCAIYGLKERSLFKS